MFASGFASSDLMSPGGCLNSFRFVFAFLFGSFSLSLFIWDYFKSLIYIHAFVHTLTQWIVFDHITAYHKQNNKTKNKLRPLTTLTREGKKHKKICKRWDSNPCNFRYQDFRWRISSVDAWIWRLNQLGHTCTVWFVCPSVWLLATHHWDRVMI